MKELQRKQQIKRRIYSLPVLTLLLIFTLFIVRGTVRILEKKAESKRHLASLEGNVATLSLRSQELDDKIRRLDTEEGIIKEIKEKFSVSEEGEFVAVIVEESSNKDDLGESSESWYRSWKDMIKSLWQ